MQSKICCPILLHVSDDIMCPILLHCDILSFRILKNVLVHITNYASWHIKNKSQIVSVHFSEHFTITIFY